MLARLANELDERFEIVIVGDISGIPCELPENVLHIRRTFNAKELAEIYTASNVFANPTREKVLGLVNIESICDVQDKRITCND